jgi:hypothetical protein
MKKALISPVFVFALLFAFGSVTIAQMVKKGWEKTVTLPSDEVVLDMSGEWDSLFEFYGVFNGIQPVTGIVSITQEGTIFTGVKQIASMWIPKGTETIKGEMDKDGFKAVYVYIGSEAWDGRLEWEECKWESSENGNKICVDCGERAKRTLTRR